MGKYYSSGYITITVILCIFYPGDAIRCLVCQSVYQPSECNIIRTCPLEEACYIDRYTEFGVNKYRFGCLPKQICSTIVSGKPDIVGRRSEEDFSRRAATTYHCCDKDLCNDQRNGTQTPLTTVTTTSTGTTNVLSTPVSSPTTENTSTFTTNIPSKPVTSVTTEGTISSRTMTTNVNVSSTSVTSGTTATSKTVTTNAPVTTSTAMTTVITTNATSSGITNQPVTNASVKDTFGRDFVIMLPMDSYYSRNIKTVITATENGFATICIPANGTCQNHTIIQGDNVFKLMVKGKVELEKMTVQKKAVTVTASVDVSLLIVVLADNTGRYDSYYDTLYLALPVDMLSTEYVSSSYRTYYNASYSYSYVAVAAVEDGTEVNFTLNIGEGFISKIPYMGQFYIDGDVITVQLDRYETFQVGGSADFTGTSVHSTKPIALLSGSFHTNIISHGDEDFIAQMIPPNDCLKTKFIIPPFMSRTGYVFRVISPDDNATIVINSNNTYQLSSNSSFYDYESNITEPVTVSSDRPVLTVLYAQSGFDIYDHKLSFNYGGGNMVIVPGISQYLSNYTFTVPSVPAYIDYVIVRNKTYVSVISETSNTNAIRFDGNSLSIQDPEKYNIMLESTSYDIRSFEIKPGFHNIYSTTGHVFGLINYGFKWATGYGSPVYLKC